MNLLAHLPWHRTAPTHRLSPATAPADDDPATVGPQGDADTAGCGWFDSSHDLQNGLLVTEHASADTVANEMPLEAWLDLHLNGWRPPQGGVH